MHYQSEEEEEEKEQVPAVLSNIHEEEILSTQGDEQAIRQVMWFEQLKKMIVDAEIDY